MQTVITAEQAKAITHGRTPMLPAEYELALTALAECTTLDEAKYWDSKADVLAAWSKIYHSDEVMRRARILKLHAYRRMSELIAQLKSHRKAADSPTKTLKMNGLSAKQVQGVMAVGRLSQGEFDKVTAGEKIPSPTGLIPGQYRRGGWPGTAGDASVEALRSFHYFCTRVSAESVAKSLGAKDKAFVLKAAEEVSDWLSELTEELM